MISQALPLWLSGLIIKVMLPKEAQTLVKKYGDLIVNREGLAGRKSDLPCSIDNLKQAFFIVVDVLIKGGVWTDGVRNEVISTYSMMNVFVDDQEAEEINFISKNLKKEDSTTEMKWKWLQFSKKLYDENLRREISDYIDGYEKKKL